MLFIQPKHDWYWPGLSLGIAYLASVLDNNGVCKVGFFDCQLPGNDEKRMLEALNFDNTVGISVNAGTVSSALDISRLIRERSPHTRIIMGGPHATAVYDKLIPKYADIVIMGEGEDTILELFKTDDLSLVRGVAYWDGQLRVNPAREFITDLDRIPYPAWNIFELKKYKFGGLLNPYVGMMTSRGCPNQCIYCTKFVHGSNIRLRSVDNVVGEIDYLTGRFGVREISILDDNFTFYPNRVQELCERIIKNNYKKLRFNLLGGIRAEFGDIETFRLLKRSGVERLSIGVETGSQEVSDKSNRKLDLGIIRSTIQKVKKAGIQPNVLMMVGLACDTVSTIRETINFAKSLPVEKVLFSIATPFPGTKFYDLIEKEGRFFYDLTVTSTCFTDTKRLICETQRLSAEDKRRMFKEAYRQFYLRPLQICKLIISGLKYYRNFFGLLKDRMHLFLYPG